MPRLAQANRKQGHNQPFSHGIDRQDQLRQQKPPNANTRYEWISTESGVPRNKPQLFCFPHAGWGGSGYRPWQVGLAEVAIVLPVYFPGHEHRIREPLFDQLCPLAKAAAEAIAPHIVGEFALFGHSMGAFVAFEVARSLRRIGLLACGLWAAAAPAPHLPLRLPPLHHLPEVEMIERLEARYGELPAEVKASREMMSAITPVIRADLRAVETYRYEPEIPLDCPIHVLGGAEDTTVSMAELAAWRAQTRGAFSCRILPGGHFFIENARREVLSLVARQLRSVS